MVNRTRKNVSIFYPFNGFALCRFRLKNQPAWIL
jgi:hypothetical protein